MSKEYFEKTEYLSSSVLKEFYKSVGHGKAYLAKKKEPTPQMQFGTLWHALMEGKELLSFDAPINPKTGEPYGVTSQKYQDAYINFQAGNPEATICSTSEMEKLQLMKANLMRDYAQIINLKGNHEKAIYIEQSQSFCEHPVKCLVDKLCIEQGIMFDWKTTSETDLSKVKWDFYKYGYDLQMFHYLKCVEALLPYDSFEFYFVFTQTVEPYESIVINAMSAYSSGEQKHNIAIYNYNEYLKGNHPPVASNFGGNKENFYIVNLENL